MILEIFRDHLRVAFLKVDAKGKATILKTNNHNIADLAEAGTLIKRFKRLKRKKIIVALGSHLATTIYSSINLVREHSQDIIEEAELDNLVSRAIWKFFDRRRAAIAKKMSVSDLDLVFVNARVQGISLDGHKVVNPLGFKARNIRVAFRQTFLTRQGSDFIKEILPLDRIILIGEAGSFILNALCPETPSEKFLLTITSANHTDVFFSNGGEHAFWNMFSWGSAKIVDFISEYLTVSKTVADTIINKYLAGETSAAFSKRFEKMIIEGLNPLSSGLSSALKRTKATVVFMHNRFILPPVIFRSSWQRKFIPDLASGRLPPI